MIVGCYSMHLYCVHTDLPVTFDHRDGPPKKGQHRHGEFPHQFEGATEAECKRKARGRGWRFTAGDAVCPRCARKAA